MEDYYFKAYWEKNQAVFSGFGISETAASVLFYAGMACGAQIVLSNVDDAMKNLKNATNAGKEVTG